MPIYEFRRLQCGHIFELFQVRSDEEIEMKCPECGGENIERVMSRVGGFSVRGSETMPRSTFRSCAGGTCATIEVPGPER